jgi:hypothetical protein
MSAWKTVLGLVCLTIILVLYFWKKENRRVLWIGDYAMFAGTLGMFGTSFVSEELHHGRMVGYLAGVNVNFALIFVTGLLASVVREFGSRLADERQLRDQRQVASNRKMLRK